MHGRSLHSWYIIANDNALSCTCETDEQTKYWTVELQQSVVSLRKWQATFYLTLLDFMCPEPVQRTNMQSEGVSRRISCLIKIIKTGLKSQTLDSDYQKSQMRHFSPSAMTRSNLVQVWLCKQVDLNMNRFVSYYRNHIVSQAPPISNYYYIYWENHEFRFE